MPTPYRTAFAIFVRETAEAAPAWQDRLPPVLEERILSLRGYDAEGMLRRSVLTQPGEVEAGIVSLFGDEGIGSIHAHTAANGCFLACIRRA